MNSLREFYNRQNITILYMNLLKGKSNYFCALLLVCLLSSFIWQDRLNAIIQDGAQLEKNAAGFLFTEGPTSDTDGSVFFTEQPNDRFMVLRPSGVIEIFLQPSGRSNELSFDNHGNL
jgi:gluconolactonase